MGLTGGFAPAKNCKELISNPVQRFQLQGERLFQSGNTRAISNRRRAPAAKYFRADCQMQFVDQSSLKESAVYFAASLA
jgi:hypothetical protein